MKKVLFFILFQLFFCISFLHPYGIEFTNRTKLYVVESEKEVTLSPFVILSTTNEEINFLGSLFSPKKVHLKEESRELSWKPQILGEKIIYPRIIQSLKLDDHEYEISFIPSDRPPSIGYRVLLSFIKTVSQDKNEFLFPLKCSFDKTPEGKSLNIEIKGGEIIYICFPIGKRIYILSFSTSLLIGGVV